MANELAPASATALPLLSDQAREFIGQSARPNTRRAYAAQLKQWLAWCEDQGLAPFPADPTRVANYLSERAVKGQSVSTLRTVVAAIKAGHDAQGLQFDTKAPAIVRRSRARGEVFAEEQWLLPPGRLSLVEFLPEHERFADELGARGLRADPVLPEIGRGE